VLGGRVPVPNVLGKRLQANALDFRGNRIVDLAKRPGLPVENLVRQLFFGFRNKGWPATQQLVEHDRKTVNVCAAVEAGGLAANLFGRHVGKRSGKPMPFLGQIFLTYGQTKIGDSRLTAPIEQNIRGLDVSMSQTL